MVCINQYNSLLQVYFLWLIITDVLGDKTKVIEVIKMLIVRANLLSYY